MCTDPAVALTGEAVAVVDKQLLDQVFSGAQEDPGEKFLKDYIATHAWDEDTEENHVPLHEQVVPQSAQVPIKQVSVSHWITVDKRHHVAQVAEQLAEDEHDLEQAEHFEAAYNFRFQVHARHDP